MWLVYLPFPHQDPVNTSNLMGRKMSESQGAISVSGILAFYLPLTLQHQYYLRQGGWVFGGVCCLSAGKRKDYLPSFHETWWKGIICAKEEPTTFASGSESQGGYIFHLR